MAKGETRSRLVPRAITELEQGIVQGLEGSGVFLLIQVTDIRPHSLLEFADIISQGNVTSLHI